MKTRNFLIVFLYQGPSGPAYRNCWLNLVGSLNQNAFQKAAKEMGLPDDHTIICVQELEE
jgi:hypothetical protein